VPPKHIKIAKESYFSLGSLQNSGKYSTHDLPGGSGISLSCSAHHPPPLPSGKQAGHDRQEVRYFLYTLLCIQIPPNMPAIAPESNSLMFREGIKLPAEVYPYTGAESFLCLPPIGIIIPSKREKEFPELLQYPKPFTERSHL